MSAPLSPGALRYPKIIGNTYLSVKPAAHCRIGGIGPRGRRGSSQLSGQCQLPSEIRDVSRLGVSYASSVTTPPSVTPIVAKFDSRWQAVVERDTTADGSFYFSVSTTGIYCRPSCSARLPRRENVDFHPSPEHAEQAGYRACKRCRPNEVSRAEREATQVQLLCRLIDSSDGQPSLEKLAEAIGASSSHTYRVFKRIAGVTPKQYAAEKRRQRVGSVLRCSSSVTEAIYASGFGSPARFYDSAKNALGMSPQIYRSGGSGERIHFAIAESSLGALLVAATERGICAILMGDEPQTLIDDLEARFSGATLTGARPQFDSLVATVVGLVEHPEENLSLSLDIRGTVFQQRVWSALRKIPSGQTLSYAELAARIGSPKSVRAVARACSANPLAIAVPCHRIVRRDGGLSGYRWGVERKRELLERERRK